MSFTRPVTTPKMPRRIAVTRTEILGLIDELRAQRLHASPARSAAGAAPVNRRARPLSERPVMTRPYRANSARTVPDPERTQLWETLERIEQRLEAVEKSAPRRPKATEPPAADPLGNWTFSGAIQGQLLSDMLQLVSSNSMSGVFVIEGEGAKSTLYFNEGKMCHAELNGSEGETAFFAAFGFQTGRYYFRETSDIPAKETITSSTQFLILEALRQIDEAQAE